MVMRVLIGCEHSGVVRRAFRKRGHAAWSCDLLPPADGSSYHYQGDVRDILDLGWDLAIFHPDCTYLTSAAAWAYALPDYDRYPGVGYHQKVKPGTLVGYPRAAATEAAATFVIHLYHAPIPRVAIENPIGIMSTRWRKPDQIIHPHMFGDDASKATCLWLKGLPRLVPTAPVAPRMVGIRPRWGNQTDSGQNKLGPSDDRWALRAKTYQGIADAFASQWG
jgi:hypothetical protein